MESLARRIDCLDLGALPGYGELFIQCLDFPPAEGESARRIDRKIAEL
jgi:hypothetical protein